MQFTYISIILKSSEIFLFNDIKEPVPVFPVMGTHVEMKTGDKIKQ